MGALEKRSVGWSVLMRKNLVDGLVGPLETEVQRMKREVRFAERETRSSFTGEWIGKIRRQLAIERVDNASDFR